jgi:hypothetical protein
MSEEKPSAPDALTALKKRITELEQQIVSGFYEEEIPSFTQGVPTHELQSVVTAAECEGYVDKIKQLAEVTAKRDALKAANTKLLGALDMIREQLTGGNVQDLLYTINAAINAAKETK